MFGRYRVHFLPFRTADSFSSMPNFLGYSRITCIVVGPGSRKSRVIRIVVPVLANARARSLNSFTVDLILGQITRNSGLLRIFSGISPSNRSILEVGQVSSETLTEITFVLATGQGDNDYQRHDARKDVIGHHVLFPGLTSGEFPPLSLFGIPHDHLGPAYR